MKNIALIAIALLASAAFGEPSGPYMAYLGYDVGNGGSGEYSNYIGAYSGQYSTVISRCGFYGAASGQYGYKLYGCNGVGFYALANSEYMTNVFAVGTSAGRGASNCEDCIFIGKDAGRNASCKNGVVDIGGRFCVLDKNSFYITPDKSKGVTTAPILFADNRFYFRFPIEGGGVVSENYDGGTHNANVNLTNGGGVSASYISATFININGGFENITALYNGVPKSIESYVEEKSKSSAMEIVGKMKNITIEDEDTGEKYIIKVKSGVLKLYKVEETEE